MGIPRADSSALPLQSCGNRFGPCKSERKTTLVLRKFLIMGLLALGFAVYCLYDGLIAYPARRDVGFAEFKSDYKTTLFRDDKQAGLTVTEFENTADDEDRHTWDHYAHDRQPSIPSRPDVIMQFIMATLTTLTGLFLVSLPLRRAAAGSKPAIGHHFEVGRNLPLRRSGKPKQA